MSFDDDDVRSWGKDDYRHDYRPVRYVECAHCGEMVGTYNATCPYCGYRLVDARQAIMRGLQW